MKILIFEWGAGTFSYRDTIAAFDKMGINYRTVSYAFKDVNEDDFFENRFSKCIEEGDYDAVYSTNFFPLVAKCCYKKNLLYISWSYDNPLDVPDIEKSLGYETNRVFLFDKLQVAKYKNMGFDNVFHMPLAANVKRLEGIKPNGRDIATYSADISFVGKIYDSALPLLMSAMNERTRGYLDGIMNAQSRIYGYYLVDDLITDELIEDISKQFKEQKVSDNINLTKEALSFAMGAQLTRNERILLLNLLAAHFDLKLYSGNGAEYVKKANYMGTCRYYDEMPLIFKLSKVNLNINLRVSKSGIPLRAVDVLGAGGFLLSSYQNELDEYIGNGNGVVLYDSVEAAYELADYYIKHESDRMKIAAAGHEIVAKEFTYEKKLSEIFKQCGCLL